MISLLARFFMLPRPAQSPAPAPEPKPAKPAKPSAKPAKTSGLLKPEPKYYQQTNKRTPNISAGRVIKPTHVILHHTSGAYAGSVAWCLNPASKVSYHCIIARNGKRTVLALPTQRTWHAGVSSWQGRKDVNSFSIGMAWEGDTYTTTLSEDALLSAVEYLLPILRENHIPLANIIRHADISPGRKNDCSPAAHAALLAALNRVL
jgi:N-acetyl-anhydromuramyl-L-alanine amidase AmpD